MGSIVQGWACSPVYSRPPACRHPPPPPSGLVPPRLHPLHPQFLLGSPRLEKWHFKLRVVSRHANTRRSCQIINCTRLTRMNGRAPGQHTSIPSTRWVANISHVGVPLAQQVQAMLQRSQAAPGQRGQGGTERRHCSSWLTQCESLLVFVEGCGRRLGGVYVGQGKGPGLRVLRGSARMEFQKAGK